jgi:Transglycosylase associated protein
MLLKSERLSIRRPSLVRDVILGVIGAVLGDAIFTELGLVGVTGVNLTSIVVAAIGAISCARSLSFAYEPARPCMKF